MKSGRLVVLGSGLISPQHMSLESKRHIEAADCVYYLVPDLLGADFITNLNNNTIDLSCCYAETSHRRATYSLMVERILSSVRKQKSVAVVFYGHPGVFVTPSFEAIQKAKEEGFHAMMLPAISSEDCLIADLQIDPGTVGCQSYEASYFLLKNIQINPQAPLILWQIGVAADFSFSTNLKPHPNALHMLKDKLLKFYPESHKMAFYEAATLPAFKPKIDWFPLAELTKQGINEVTTLFIPNFNNLDNDQDFLTRWNIRIPDKEGAKYV